MAPAVGGIFWGVAGALIGFVAGIALSIVISMIHSFLQYEYSNSLRLWFRTRFNRGMAVAEIARRLDMRVDELRAFQPRYQEVFIPKRSGGKRRLMVPDDATKVVQRRILKRLLRKLKTHPCAYGFVRGRSIVDHANQHIRQAVVIRLDIVDFFPNTKASRVERYFNRIGWNREAAALLARLTTHEDGLPQGAPTSPCLSNLVNYYMDVQIQNRVKQKGGTYSRYADDITISFPLDYTRNIQRILSRVRRITKKKGYTLHKGKKKSIRRHHQRQCVTGLVVNDLPRLPRETRRWLRAVRHRLKQGKPATLTPAQVQGWEALEKMIAEGRKRAPERTYRAEEIRTVINRRQRHDKNRNKPLT
ncbi:MAG: RNA-directed DNA polymerase [Planctomycetota bacterium]|nr:RNA-directed DNA polymerase [Planctomycetota bacterium]